MPIAGSNNRKGRLNVPQTYPSMDHSVSSVESTSTTEHKGSIPISSGHVKALINTFQNKETTSMIRTSSSHSISSNSRSLRTYPTPESSIHSYLDSSDIRSRVARDSLLKEFDEEISTTVDFNVVDHNSLDPRSFLNSPYHYSSDTQRYLSHKRDISPAAMSTSSQSHDSQILSIAAVAAEKPLKKHRSKVSISSNGSEFVDVVVNNSTKNKAGMADYHALEMGIRLSLEQVRTNSYVQILFLCTTIVIVYLLF